MKILWTKKKVVQMATKEDNPFLSMVSVMQQEGSRNNPTPFFIGIVTRSSPLRVRIGDIEIGREQMKVCSSLLVGFSQQLSISETAASGSTKKISHNSQEVDAFYSHSHDIMSVSIPNGTFTLLSNLQVGDEVLILMSADQQQFVCVCKIE